MEGKPSFSPSSSSPPAKRFHVFLSFRGEDTRNNFTGHLSHALRKIGLFNIFKDDYALHKGKDIGPELMKAIIDSQYAVVVLSENYADSHWCLKELAKIVECMGDSGRIRTIFYHVNPSHVRNLKGSFGKAMEKHEKDPRHSSEEVQSWREALTKVANQSGEPVQSYRDEASFIQKFISELSSELGASIRTIEGLFGMTSRVEKLHSNVLKSLDTHDVCFHGIKSLDTHKVCFLGIHGMGGIGKSTLAEAYYLKMSHEFDSCSFLANVRETCEKQANGIVNLQMKLLKDILGVDCRVDNLSEGKNLIRDRLRAIKVLIILDNVNKPEQLEALADSHKKKQGSENELDMWFGPGSVIIVTTRKEDLLGKRYTKYKAELLSDNEALQLFSWKAFERIEPREEFKELSNEVVKYASNLPLALTVLGSHLSSKKQKSQWEDALCRLSNCPEKNIVEKLKISFDDLDDADKCIFLDIACFFNHCNKDSVIQILESCGLKAEYGISNLIDKSLLSIHEETYYEESEIWMHDLLEEMGKYIVRKESNSELDRQSRIWDEKDLHEILENTEGTNKVEAIVAFARTTEYSSEAWLHIKKLRLLKIYELGWGPDDCVGPELSNNLQYLEWNWFPYTKFPSSFQPRKLVQLTLHNSEIKQLWKNGIKPLYHLKVIDLRGSRSFTKFEDFTVVPNLEKLILRGCDKLSEIDPSIKHLGKLILLDLDECTSLEKLPQEINGLTSLQTLTLVFCDQLHELPDNLEPLKSLRMLDIQGSAIEHLPSSIFLLENLESVPGYSDEMIESVIRENILSYFPGWFCTRIIRLNLSNCNLTGPEAFPENFGILAFLKELDLSKNPFSVLPTEIKGLTNLQSLRLKHCKSLRCLVPELLPSSLKEIYVDYCTSLGSFLDPLKPCHLRCSKVNCLDCTELVKRQDGKLTALASLSRFLEDPNKTRYHKFKFVVPQSDNELPSWFINQSSTASISIKLDPNWHNMKCIGFAMVFCFPAISSTNDRLYYKIRVRGSQNWETARRAKYIGITKSDHLCLLYIPYETFFLEFMEQLEHSSIDTLEISFLIDEDWLECGWRKTPDQKDVQSSHSQSADDEHCSSCGPCGVRLVYEEDIGELKQIISKYNDDQKGVESSHSQSVSQLSKRRRIVPIGSPH